MKVPTPFVLTELSGTRLVTHLSIEGQLVPVHVSKFFLQPVLETMIVAPMDAAEPEFAPTVTSMACVA